MCVGVCARARACVYVFVSTWPCAESVVSFSSEFEAALKDLDPADQDMAIAASHTCKYNHSFSTRDTTVVASDAKMMAKNTM